MTDDNDPKTNPQEILDWGPGRGGGSSRELVEAWTPSRGEVENWGAYYNVLFQPRMVTPWIKFKRMSSGVNIARRLWDEREDLRRGYETHHGVDPGQWPVSHPGAVLENVKWIAHPACLRCQWLHADVYMKEGDWRNVATDHALRHQELGGPP